MRSSVPGVRWSQQGCSRRRRGADGRMTTAIILITQRRPDRRRHQPSSGATCSKKPRGALRLAARWTCRIAVIPTSRSPSRSRCAEAAEATARLHARASCTPRSRPCIRAIPRLPTSSPCLREPPPGRGQRRPCRSSSNGRRCSRPSPRASSEANAGPGAGRACSIGHTRRAVLELQEQGLWRLPPPPARRRQPGLAQARARRRTDSCAPASRRTRTTGPPSTRRPMSPADGLDGDRRRRPASRGACSPPRAYAARVRARQRARPRASRPGRASMPLVAAALKATNGALAQAGARLVPLGPGQVGDELRRHRMTLRVEVDGDDVARMHIERLPHEMEVAVGVRDAAADRPRPPPPHPRRRHDDPRPGRADRQLRLAGDRALQGDPPPGLTRPAACTPPPIEVAARRRSRLP